MCSIGLLAHIRYLQCTVLTLLGALEDMLGDANNLLGHANHPSCTTEGYEQIQPPLAHMGQVPSRTPIE